MMPVEAVIFDFGGVILDVDYAATSRAMRALLGENAHVTFTQTEQSQVFDLFEIGELAPATFYARMMAAAQRELNRQDIDKAWNAILGETRLERLNFLKQVARHRRIFLLSNTNAIHKAEFDRRLQRLMGAESFDSLFEQAYYSHLMGLRKPNPEIYRYVIQRHGLRAERTLFIDDSAGNLEGARQLGLQTFHLQEDLLAAPLAFLTEPL